MKPLLYAAALVLALLVGGLLYYLPHRAAESPGEVVVEAPRTAAMTRPAAPPPSLGQPPLAATEGAPPAPDDTAPAPPPAAPPKPSMAEIDAIVAKLKEAHDEATKEMLMHDFIATAAKMDFHDQMIARDRLDTIQHKYDPPSVIPPAVHFMANVDASAP